MSLVACTDKKRKHRISALPWLPTIIAHIIAILIWIVCFVSDSVVWLPAVFTTVLYYFLYCFRVEETRPLVKMSNWIVVPSILLMILGDLASYVYCFYMYANPNSVIGGQQAIIALVAIGIYILLPISIVLRIIVFTKALKKS